MYLVLVRWGHSPSNEYSQASCLTRFFSALEPSPQWSSADLADSTNSTSPCEKSKWESSSIGGRYIHFAFSMEKMCFKGMRRDLLKRAQPRDIVYFLHIFQYWFVTYDPPPSLADQGDSWHHADGQIFYNVRYNRPVQLPKVFSRSIAVPLFLILVHSLFFFLRWRIKSGLYKTSNKKKPSRTEVDINKHASRPSLSLQQIITQTRLHSPLHSNPPFLFLFLPRHPLFRKEAAALSPSPALLHFPLQRWCRRYPYATISQKEAKLQSLARYLLRLSRNVFTLSTMPLFKSCPKESKKRVTSKSSPESSSKSSKRTGWERIPSRFMLTQHYAWKHRWILSNLCSQCRVLYCI